MAYGAVVPALQAWGLCRGCYLGRNPRLCCCRPFGPLRSIVVSYLGRCPDAMLSRPLGPNIDVLRTRQVCTLAKPGLQHAADEYPTMTWIKTIPIDQADETLQAAMAGARALYPEEYRTPVEGVQTREEQETGTGGIMNSHSLLPEVLFHAFAAFGALLNPDLPLSRRQHEMIAATVSALNRCFY